MAGIQVQTGGGRRSVDSNINMVPMIDLLVSTIAFLLMTAVWTQTGSVRSQQPKSNDAPSSEPVAEHLRVVVSPTGFEVGHTALDTRHVDGGPGGMRALRTLLAEHRRATPGERDVWVQPDGTVAYDDVVHVMDAIYDVWSAGAPAGHVRSDQVVVSLM